ncbi:pseudouridine synthase [Novosphingobium sp. YJ-S2-02]|uniref:Pseudouridine synthase n=1 Tax=Novosphingobium aureum TaxID=2792964 RepID=A0A931MKJ4_9SPHN|nr:pseudouridine synthase [Novosphingobium aureum]MBH0112883.1 pseudouridine synthase [Novosphingobium aureum]
MSKPPRKSGGPTRGRNDASDSRREGRPPRARKFGKPDERHSDERKNDGRKNDGRRRDGGRDGERRADRRGNDAPRGRFGEKRGDERRGSDAPRTRFGEKRGDERRGSDAPRTRFGEKRGDERRGSDAPRTRFGEKRTDERRGSDTPRPRFGEKRTDERRGNDAPRGRSGEKRGNERRFGDAPRANKPFAVKRPAPGSKPRAAAPTPKDPNLPAREGERIAKLLARAGIASRREVERMIAEGRVKLDDAVIDTPATVLTSLAGVTVDGHPVPEAQATRLFAFHKPGGLITAEFDPAGRPTIYAALRNALPEGAGRVMPVGRLDFNTEGLLLLTNDGEFKRTLELPASGIPRTYRARAFGDITQEDLEGLIEGIEIDGVHYGRIDANMERGVGRNRWIEMTITEGKNREVRRVLEHFGLKVSRLIRIGYGPFALDELPKGAAVEITAKEIEGFRRDIGKARAK